MTHAADALRVVAVATYAAVMLMALWTTMYYYQAYKQAHSRWLGLLPKHVYLIGISYISYATSSITISLDAFGDPLTPYTVLNLVGGIAGSMAMTAMLRHQTRRIPTR